MGQLLVSQDAAKGLLNFANLDICGFQANLVDCETGSPLTDDKSVVVGCGINEAGLEPERSEGRSATGRCASVDKPGKITHYNLGITMCEEVDVQFRHLAGLAEAILVDDAADQTEVVGLMDIDHDTAGDDCCQPSTGCANTNLALMFWTLNYCGTNKLHPDFTYTVLVLPNVEIDQGGDGFTLSYDDFNEFEFGGKALRPDAGFGRGPGDVLPAHIAGTRRRWYKIGTNSPPPACGNCGQCR